MKMSTTFSNLMEDGRVWIRNADSSKQKEQADQLRAEIEKRGVAYHEFPLSDAVTMFELEIADE